MDEFMWQRATEHVRAEMLARHLVEKTSRPDLRLTVNCSTFSHWSERGLGRVAEVKVLFEETRSAKGVGIFLEVGDVRWRWVLVGIPSCILRVPDAKPARELAENLLAGVTIPDLDERLPDSCWRW